MESPSCPLMDVCVSLVCVPRDVGKFTVVRWGHQRIQEKREHNLTHSSEDLSGGKGRGRGCCRSTSFKSRQDIKRA